LLSTQETHKFIGNLDLLVAGRAHAAIAGLCQAVPTILIDYGHGPTAHKTIGFMELYNQENSLINPSEPLTFGRVLEKMWNERKSISEKLISQHRTVLAQVDEMGDHIAQLASKDYVRTP
jgi:colanic acid/amylovoran biosynthesis protein